MNKYDKQYEEMLNDVMSSKPEKKDGFTTYRRVVREGYLGEFCTEWWDDEDWKKHYEDVQRLKENGTYGKPSIVSLTLKDNPLTDNTKTIKPKKDSYKMIFINLRGQNKDK